MWERLDSITEDTTDPSELAALRAQRIMPIEDVPEDLPEMVYDGGLDEVLDEVDGERFLRLVFTSLNDREATVLKMRYGFPEVGGEPMTLDAIGETMNVTRERIRQIESKAKDKMTAMAGIVQGTQSSKSRSPREGRRSPSSAA
jgi:RNA polymerase sigma factor (sigma-70 family)